MIDWLKTFVAHPVVTHVGAGVLGILFGVFIILIGGKLRRWYRRAGEIRCDATELKVKAPAHENQRHAESVRAFQVSKSQAS